MPCIWTHQKHHGPCILLELSAWVCVACLLLPWPSQRTTHFRDQPHSCSQTQPLGRWVNLEPCSSGSRMSRGYTWKGGLCYNHSDLKLSIKPFGGRDDPEYHPQKIKSSHTQQSSLFTYTFSWKGKRVYFHLKTKTKNLKKNAANKGRRRTQSGRRLLWSHE